MTPEMETIGRNALRSLSSLKYAWHGNVKEAVRFSSMNYEGFSPTKEQLSEIVKWVEDNLPLIGLERNTNARNHQ